MKNFNKINATNDARTELHDTLQLTGAEISVKIREKRDYLLNRHPVVEISSLGEIRYYLLRFDAYGHSAYLYLARRWGKYAGGKLKKRRFTASVRTYDNGCTASELELRSVGKGFESLHFK